MNSISKTYTFLLLASALIGVNFLTINLGAFELSIYRILLLLSPIFFFFINKEAKYGFKTGSNRSYFYFLVIWVIYAIISLIWVRDIAGWIRGFSFLLSACIASWFIAWNFSNVKDFITALRIIEGIALILGAFGIYEIFTGNYLFLTSEKLIYYENYSYLESSIGRFIPVSIFDNPNDFSLFLLFAVFVSIALFKIKNSNLGKLFSLSSVIYFIFLLFASQSRSGFIGLLIGVLLLIYLSVRNYSFTKRTLITSLMVLVIFLTFNWIVKNKTIFEPLISFNSQTGSDRIRINLLENGLVFLKNSLFMGIGVGNIEYYMTNDTNLYTENINNIHNWWAEILVSSGIIIFLLYLIIYLRNLIKLLKLSLNQANRNVASISVSFFCFLFAFAISAVGSSSLMSAEWLWVVVALIAGFINVISKFKIIES
jgi:teichuronic acid biosynthesis protein TuaE